MPTYAIGDTNGLLFAVHSGARVAILISWQPVRVVTLDLHVTWNLVLLTFGLLHAEHIRLLVLDVRMTIFLKQKYNWFLEDIFMNTVHKIHFWDY